MAQLLTAGTRLADRFLLERQLRAEGGRQVWVAKDQELDETVVLELARSDDPAALELLGEEAASGLQSDGDWSFVVGGDLRPPVLLQPPPRPERRAAPAAGQTRPSTTSLRSIPHLATTLLFALLLTAAVVVFGLLPRWVASAEPEDSTPPAALSQPSAEEPTPEAVSTGRSPVAGSTPPRLAEDPRPAYDRARLDRLLGRKLELEEELDRRGVELWGGELLAEARAAIARAEEQLGAGDRAAATDHYEEGVAGLEQLEATVPELLARALRDGEQALRIGNGEEAEAAFSLAARLEPGHRQAAAGLRRAEVAAEVVTQVATAEQLENEGKLEAAVRGYRRALELDAASQAARSGLDRVQRRLRADAFSRALGEGLRLLDSGDPEALRTARQALERAKGLRPESAEVREALARLEARVRLAAIGEHRQAALEHERSEDWHAAVREYGAALEIDSSLRFAREGRLRAAARADLEDRLRSHLDRPRRLAEESVLESARALLEEGAEVAEPGPELRGQLAALERLVEAWQTEVPVIVQSDGLTEITIYRVGRLGTLTRRELSLRPGTYTVVGHRRGFRDVRHELVLEPGSSPEPVVVRCQEPI